MIDGRVYFVPARTRGENSNPADPTPLLFDLKAAGVPRFKTNARFEIRLHVHASDGGEYEDRFYCSVPLPVIMVSGIQPIPYLGPPDGVGAFADLTAYLEKETRRKFLGSDPESKGTPYRLYNPDGTTHYPTLNYAKYNVNYDPFSKGADAVQLAWQQVWAKTWSDRFYLIGHSKGGLVVRHYVQMRYTEGGSFPVIAASTAQSPHLGAPVASWFPNFQKVRGYDYKNLYPAYNNYQLVDYRTDPINGVRKPWENFYALSNGELNEINDGRKPWPSAVPLLMLRSRMGVNPLGTLWGTQRVIPTFGAAFPIPQTELGDDIVPYFSQSARMYDPNDKDQDINQPDTLPRVKSLEGADAARAITVLDFTGSHVGFLSQPDVMRTYFRLFSTGLF